MNDFDLQIEKYIKKYQIDKKPISVSFRNLIPDLNYSDRATHLIHAYPAKLVPHIPYFFLNNNIFSQKHDKVLDPFCGSGTVSLETALSGRIPVGADSNPLARLITRTKIRPYNTALLNYYKNGLLDDIDLRKRGQQPYVVNIDYWFLPKIKKQLAVIYEAIERIVDEDYRDFFHVCFSNMIKKVSLADPRVSVPVRLNPNRYPEKHELRNESKQLLKSLEALNLKIKFSEIINQNIKRFERLNCIVNMPAVDNFLSEDARKLKSLSGHKLRSDSIQLIISSPPYSGAQKYIRSSSLNLGWLGLTKEETTLRRLDSVSIGRENYNNFEYKELKITGITPADILLKKIYKKYPERAHIAANYLIEMKDAMAEAVRVLKKDGYIVLVIGNNQICGCEFETQKYLRIILESLGLEVVFALIDDIRSYGLMTKRNKTASIITREWVLGFKKK